MMTITATKYIKGLSVGNDLDTKYRHTSRVFALITRPPPLVNRDEVEKDSTKSADVSIRSDPRDASEIEAVREVTWTI